MKLSVKLHQQQPLLRSIYHNTNTILKPKLHEQLMWQHVLILIKSDHGEFLHDTEFLHGTFAVRANNANLAEYDQELDPCQSLSPRMTTLVGAPSRSRTAPGVQSKTGDPMITDNQRCNQAHCINVWGHNLLRTATTQQLKQSQPKCSRVPPLLRWMSGIQFNLSSMVLLNAADGASNGGGV